MADAELVAQALAGNPAGLAGIYDRYADRIYDYARSMLRNDADAADVTQDTFLVGAQRLGQLRDPDKLRPWLYAIARSRGLAILRARQRVDVRDEIDESIEMTTSDAALDAQRLVREAADGLEDGDRDILDLHLRHGIEGQELADVLGVSSNAANVALHRVRERFQQAATAVLLARSSRGECSELDQMVHGGLTPLVRKRVTRHTSSCEICGPRSTSLRPLAAFAGIPLAGAPASLRDTVLTSAGSAEATELASQMAWRADGFASTPPLDPGAVAASVAGTASSPGAAAGAGSTAHAAARMSRAGYVAAVLIAAAALLFVFLRSGDPVAIESVASAPPTPAVAQFELTPTPAPTVAPSATPVEAAPFADPTDVVLTATPVPPTAVPPTPVPPTPVPPAPADPTPTPTTEPTPTVTPTPTPTPTVTATPTPTPVPLSVTPVSFVCGNPMVVIVDVTPVDATGIFFWRNENVVNGVPALSPFANLTTTSIPGRLTASLAQPNRDVETGVTVRDGISEPVTITTGECASVIE